MQILGTAIGTKMAPSYANFFMGKLESDLQERAPTGPIFGGYLSTTVFGLDRG